MELSKRGDAEAGVQGALAGGEEPTRLPRRIADRREPDAARAITASPAPPPSDAWFPREWHYLVGTTLFAILGCLVMAPRWPGVAVAANLLAAVTLLMSVGKAYSWAARGPEMRQAVASMAILVLPMSLFGYGMARWAAQGLIGWDAAIVALLAVGCIALLYLRQRPVMMFACNIPLWLWLAVEMRSAVAMAGLMLALLVGIRLAMHQARQDEANRAEAEARERAHLRARGILHDYEATGQGWFWETDRRGGLTYISAPIAQMLGQRPESLLGKPLAVLFEEDASSEDTEGTLASHLEAQTDFREISLRAALSGGKRWWSVSGRPLFDKDGAFTGFRGSGTDLTESRRYQEQAARLAQYDALTGLLNRRQMGIKLESALGGESGARGCSVMLLDLDRFKHVNDTMGHPAGDELLRQVSARLQDAVGSLGQVGRRGGDEFEVLLCGNANTQTLSALASTIIESVSRPYPIDRRQVSIGVSIGIACSPEHGSDADLLVRNADLALYSAKDAGRGCFRFFAESLHSAAQEQAKLERDLRQAISRGELELHYQPVVQTTSERIAGFEALLRWRHPELGWISPNKFIERAEDSGLIQQIGDWVLRTACRDAAQWPNDVSVAVNVSALQMGNPQLPATVAAAIAFADIDASRLELEVTESIFLQDNEGIDAVLAALKSVGLRLVLDDFGTGYSSLGYLERASFDKIKIDRSFISGATDEGSRKSAIIASITGLAQALGMETVAEGVETVEQLQLVRMHGCSQVQGFIYERPLDATAALERLQTGLGAVVSSAKAQRQPRRSTIQQVTLRHAGETYHATVLNISHGGALIEGLWNVPEGTVFEVVVSEAESARATVRWSSDNRMGVSLSAIERVDVSEDRRAVA